MSMRARSVLVWLTATVAAIVVASAAISQVGRQVVLEVPIDERLAEAAAAPADDPTTGADTPTPPTPPAPPVTSGEREDDEPGDEAPGTGDEDPVPSAPTGTASGGSGAHDPPPAEDVGGQRDADDTPVADDPPPAVVHTYDVIGGSAALVVVGDTVDVRWATPRDGFRVSVERSSDGRELRVEFRSDWHRSRIKAKLEHGEYREEIREDDRR